MINPDFHLLPMAGRINSGHRRPSRGILAWTGFLALTAAFMPTAGQAGETQPTTPGIPVVFSTDIGDDIDDTWALGFLLRCPELDVKLVLSEHGRPELRGRILGKFLERVGRTDVPIGLGVEVEDPPGSHMYQAGWVEGYDLGTFPGTVHRDGIQAMIDLIMSSPVPVTVIGVGPLPNIAVALQREPRIAENARFVGMHGSIDVGYFGATTPAAESNVVRDIEACQQVLSAPWDVRISPLDTCGSVRITGEKYRRLKESNDPMAQTIIENYRLREIARGAGRDRLAESRSTILFDSVAVYLAFDDALCNMETMKIRVTDDGYTRVDPSGKLMSVAISWKDLASFEDLMVERLTSER